MSDYAEMKERALKITLGDLVGDLSKSLEALRQTREPEQDRPRIEKKDSCI